jgi:hypothetical protein
MRQALCAIAMAIPVVVFTQAPADSVFSRAKRLHDRAIVVDSHDDTTERLIFDKAFDIGKRNPNGIGVMVDVSHVADTTFFDAIMTDDMMRAFARNGGVVMINYHAAFISEELRVARDKKNGNVVSVY